jgi:hypothetical protein
MQDIKLKQIRMLFFLQYVNEQKYNMSGHRKVWALEDRDSVIIRIGFSFPLGMNFLS